MKIHISPRSVIVTVALLFCFITHAQQDNPADLLTGSWIKTLQGRTITITFTAEKELQVDFVDDSDIDVWSSYTIKGNQITVTDEGGEYSANVPGVYSFKVTETSVTFTEVDDPVEGRRMIFTGEWLKPEK